MGAFRRAGLTLGIALVVGCASCADGGGAGGAGGAGGSGGAGGTAGSGGSGGTAGSGGTSGSGGSGGFGGSGGSGGAGGSGGSGGFGGAGGSGGFGGAGGTGGTGGSGGSGGSGGDPGSLVIAPGTSWQWQLSGTIDTSFDVALYDVDLVETPDAVLAELHAAGRIVICYFSAGSAEDYRDDRQDFPAAAVGLPLDGWPDERWVDVRDAGVRAVMRARLDLAKARGCDGVEPDNVDGFANASGFPLSAADQLDYNRFLAREAHARGLSVGLKNDLDQIPELVGDFDWALNEECFAYDECEALLPFLAAGKAVLQVEYGGQARATRVCPQANALGFDTLVKNLDLDATRISCR